MERLTYKQMADKYNMSVNDLKFELIAFSENEGHDENGIEYDTIEEWLKRPKFKFYNYDMTNEE